MPQPKNIQFLKKAFIEQADRYYSLSSVGYCRHTGQKGECASH
ncbi:hypothetical protein [Endozoicomonas sp. ALD040]